MPNENNIANKVKLSLVYTERQDVHYLILLQHNYFPVAWCYSDFPVLVLACTVPSRQYQESHAIPKVSSDHMKGLSLACFQSLRVPQELLRSNPTFLFVERIAGYHTKKQSDLRSYLHNTECSEAGL